MTSVFNHGEEVASEFVERILTDGGKTLYDHYLDKKSFPFAADAISDSLVATMRCTFVPHEENLEDDGESDCWDLELEPEPNPIDTWARMYVPKRRRVVRGLTEGSTNAIGGAPSDVGARGQPKAKSATTKAKKDNPEDALNRSSKLPEVFEEDPEGDMLREFKAAEEKKKREEDLKAKRAAEKRAEELKKLEAQHQEMARRHFAYDSEGNIVWVDPPNVEKLPRICEVCPYKALADKGAVPAKKDNEGDKVSPKKGQQKSDRKKKKGQEEFTFTDSFTRLATQQPPVIDTLVPKPGVLLEHKGRKKKGPPVENPEGSMSREEYKQLTENEDATGGGGGQQASIGGKGGSSPTNTQKFEDQGGSEPLPPLKESASGVPASGAAFSDLAPGPGVTGGAGPGGASPQSGDSQGGQRRRLPIAPQPNYKNKLESIGHLPRAPRQHVGPLGQVFGNGRFPQPPMGATMGHGLMRARANSSREFYFPNARDAPPLYETMGTSPTNLNSLSRTQSERSFPTPRTGFEATQNPYVWRKGPPAKIQTNASSGGYKNFRAALANVAASP